ncbi:MAG: UDP-N-acetylmuramoyl-L-alanine--D-glutamate ligase, partial [Sedimentisphaerales bacterium]|nr:UDP-N-acetylmuramoyl-L-alanine--D-glutamate ligase [Sedimentisphaerales bacterium]
MSNSLSGKRVLVMGLGRFGGGVGVCRYLVGQGAKVTVTDKDPAEKLAGSLEALVGLPIEFHLGGHDEADFRNADVVVVNPAVKRDSQYLKAAQSGGTELTSEMNLFFARCNAYKVGITGSNGKSTTTAMIYEVLKAGSEAGRLAGNVWLGGNIGRENLLCKIDEIGADDIVVLELSSFQLEDLGRMKVSPQLAVVTNISPNHLDWHGSMKAYVEAKQNILRYQGPADTAVLNRQDAALADWASLTAGKVLWYPAEDWRDIELAVPGGHNQLNAAAAWAVGEELGLPCDLVRKALAGFKGLEHRLELVGEVDGVRYYNDSIATTPESVIAAIEAFEENKIFILGGYDKGVSFAALANRLVEPGAKIKAVVLLGQVRGKLLAEINAAKECVGGSDLEVVTADGLSKDDFAAAVRLAAERGGAGDVVLMSPGC